MTDENLTGTDYVALDVRYVIVDQTDCIMCRGVDCAEVRLDMFWGDYYCKCVSCGARFDWV